MNAQPNIRQPAVAGLFYPEDATTLKQQILALMAQASPRGKLDWHPKALVAPHAGLPYSGPVAASAYAALGTGADQIRKGSWSCSAPRTGYRSAASQPRRRPRIGRLSERFRSTARRSMPSAGFPG